MIEAQTAMGLRGDFPPFFPAPPLNIPANETAAPDRTESRDGLDSRADPKSQLSPTRCESHHTERISNEENDGDHNRVGSCRPLWFTADNTQVSTVPCSCALE